jgi:hypothetical protein
MLAVRIAAVAVLVGGSLVLGGGAAGASGERGDTRPVSAAQTTAAPCVAWNLSSNLVYAYSSPSTGSAAWGFLWPGGGSGSWAQCAYTGTSTVWGAQHSLCGGGSLYVAVYFPVGGSYVIAYVPDACVWVAY